MVVQLKSGLRIDIRFGQSLSNRTLLVFPRPPRSGAPTLPQEGVFVLSNGLFLESLQRSDDRVGFRWREPVARFLQDLSVRCRRADASHRPAYQASFPLP